MILAPMVRGRGTHREVFETIQKAGFVRVRVDGVVYPLDEVPPLAPQKIARHRSGGRPRGHSRRHRRTAGGIGPTGDQAWRRRRARGVSDAGFEVGSAEKDVWEERLLNTRYACPHCGISIGEIEPRTFSFNSPYGACPTCHGLGVVGIANGNGEVANDAPLVRFCGSDSLSGLSRLASPARSPAGGLTASRSLKSRR